jgi:hypothetical protein
LDIHTGPVHGDVYKVIIGFTDPLLISSHTQNRLHLLRPHRKVMFACKIILIIEWIVITTPNAILSGVSTRTSKYKILDAYSITQRVEPAVYASVTLMLSCLYIYYAYNMFRNFGDKRIRQLLLRLLYTNIFLVVFDMGGIVAEYAGGAIVQAGYSAFFYSFVRFHY